MGVYTQPAWWPDFPANGSTVVRCPDGNAVCVIPHHRPPAEIAANATLIAMAPELLRAVGDLVDALLGLRNAAIVSGSPFDMECSDAALDDAQAILDLLAEDGVTPAAADCPADVMVVVPVPMAYPPVDVAAFKAGDGEVAFLVHTADQPRVFIGQYRIAHPLFAWARAALQFDGPLCGVLRDLGGAVVGEIGFYPGRLLKLAFGIREYSVELAQEDLDAIAKLFGEA